MRRARSHVRRRASGPWRPARSRGGRRPVVWWVFPHEAPVGGKQALAREVRDAARVEEVVSVVEDLVDGEVGYPRR